MCSPSRRGASGGIPLPVVHIPLPSARSLKDASGSGLKQLRDRIGTHARRLHAPCGTHSGALATDHVEVETLNWVDWFNNQRPHEYFVTVPSSVTVPEGETSVTFPVSTRETTSPVSVTLTASYGGYEDSATVVIVPGDGFVLQSLEVSPERVVGGNPVDGTISLANPAEEDVVVSVSSTSDNVTVPASVTVPDGSASVTFPITTSQVSGSDWAWISVSEAGQSAGASVDLVSPAPWELEEMSVSPSTVIGGGPATGRLQFDQNPDRIAVTITATYWLGTTETTTFTVVPGTPPPPDTVRIRDAEWHECILEFEATSSHPDAIMTVHIEGADGVVMRLMPDSDGRYSAEKAKRPPGTNVPVTFEVRSHLGGVDTVTLADERASVCRGDL